jgi:endonuclease-3
MTMFEQCNSDVTPPSMSRVLAQLRERYGEPKRSRPQDPVDELVATILSQHTSDLNTERAFASLKAAFPSWEAVVDATDSEVANVIRGGGLADVKAQRIRHVLREIREHVGDFDLSFLQDLPLDDARAWLTSLHGVGPKTASCVLLFSLNQPAMPVDTHVHRVSLRLGLIPERTSAERAHDLLEAMVPDGAAYTAHMLMIRHGRETCVARRPKCAGCVLVQCCPAARTFLGDEQE